MPVVIVGDGPNLPTGLARIARDLTGLFWQREQELGIKVLQLGYDYDGSPWQWPVFPMINPEEWGRGSLERLWGWLGRPEKWLVLTVWDPSRCFGLLGELIESELYPKTTLWGYFPVDSHNPHGHVGGPGGAVIGNYHRVLAYGRYGARVLEQNRGQEVDWLPHGVAMNVFEPRDEDDQTGVDPESWLAGLEAASEAGVLVGGVATNQPRKDLALFFATASKLRKTWPELRLWLHTDQAVTEAWAIPELAGVYGWNNERFTLTLHEMPDWELARAYGFCTVTLAPGGGEGFGYPIAESLACGTPVVHGMYGGGEELIPNSAWKVETVALRVSESVAHLRPVYNPEDWAAAAVSAIRWNLKEPKVVSAYCRGAVAHLGWDSLGPRWVEWLRQGLVGLL